jgi:UDP-hydrolysing UDP-N-acetyl-D-glucosamine 2-epimerase
MMDGDGVDIKVVCSASALLDRYGRVVDLIRQDGFDVVDELYTYVEGNEPINMALTTANTIQHTASFLRRLAPDWVMTIADRYETLGTAVAAAYSGIPLIHVQGGEVTGNIDERVRHAVTKLSDVHLVANEHARRRVINMGERPEAVHVTGCPSIDLARTAHELPLAEVQTVIDDMGVGQQVRLDEPFVVVLQHPETDSYQHSYKRMHTTLQVVHGFGLPTLVFWPNVDAGSDATSKAIRVFRETHPMACVRYQKNLEGKIFLRLLKASLCLVGNSSVGIRECAYLGTPVVNIGDRQLGRDRCDNVIDSDWSETGIHAAVERQLAHGNYSSSQLYGEGFAGREIARVVRGLAGMPPKRFYEG